MSSDQGSRAVGLLACLTPTGRGPQLQGLLTVRLTPVSKCPCALASVRTRSVLTRRWAPRTCSLTWSHPPPPQCGSWTPPAGEYQHPRVPPCSGTFHGVVTRAGPGSAIWLGPVRLRRGGGCSLPRTHLGGGDRGPSPCTSGCRSPQGPEHNPGGQTAPRTSVAGPGCGSGGRRPGAAPDPRDLEPSLPVNIQGPRHRRAASHPAAHEDPSELHTAWPGLGGRSSFLKVKGKVS